MHTETVADTIELELLGGNSNSRSEGWIRTSSRTAEVVGTKQIDGAIAVMHRRSELLKVAYPFEVKGVGVVRRVNALSLPYTGMLACTPGSPLLTWDDKSVGQAAEAFERMLVPAIRSLLGADSVAVRFAFPSDEGRPPEFPAAILWLASLMGIRPGNAFRPPRRKDGGVDIVGWRPFADGRAGFPVALVQATIEQRFVHKASDVDLKIWSGWLRLDVDPMVILAIPRTIPNDESWNEASTRAVILDRLRIASLLPNSIDGPEFDAVQTIVDETFATLRVELET